MSGTEKGGPVEFEWNRERKIILGIGGLLLLAGLFYNLISADRGPVSQEELLAVKAQKVLKYREKVGTQSRLENRRQNAVNRLRQAESGLLEAKTPALAAVDIQQQLTQIAGEIAAEIKTMRILGIEAVARGSYVAIPVEVTISSDIDQLVGLLYGIQNASRLLRIKDLAVRSAGVRRDEKILTTLTVEGFMRKEASG